MRPRPAPGAFLQVPDSAFVAVERLLESSIGRVVHRHLVCESLTTLG